MFLEEKGTGKPLVSIIITSYNRAYCISKAIESALAQDYNNLEIIISDNNSTDDSEKIISKYLTDKRIKYFRNPVNIGMIPNFKKATNELAKGEFVTYVSSDDYLDDPQFVSSCMSLVKADDKVRIVFGRMTTYNTHSGEKQTNNHVKIFETNIWNGFEIFIRYPEYGFLCFGGCLMKRQDLSDLKVFDSNRINFDAECILKIMILGDVGFVNRYVYVFVRHGENQSGDMTSGSHISRLEYIENVFQFANERISGRKLAELETWKKKMINHSVKASLYFLSLHNRHEFKKYVSFVREKYPSNYRDSLKSISLLLKVKLHPKIVLFIYRIFKPSYYYQEFGKKRQKNFKTGFN